MMSRIDSWHWKISSGRHFQNGHHNIAQIQHCPISTTFHRLVDYDVPKPFWKWQTSWKFWKCRIAPLMVTYHYVKFYVSIIIHLEVININVRNFKFPIGFYLLFLLRFLLLFFFFLSARHERVRSRSQKLLDRISWKLVEL
jgi:hypothetical protein